MEDTKKKGAAPTNQTISFSFRNPHDIELLEAYYFYRTTHDRRHYSRSEIIVELLTSAIRKNKDFQEYQKSLNP
jgi:hypothetical protein